MKNWNAPHFKKGKLKSWKWRDKRKNAKTAKLNYLKSQEGKEERHE